MPYLSDTRFSPTGLNSLWTARLRMYGGWSRAYLGWSCWHGIGGEFGRSEQLTTPTPGPRSDRWAVILIAVALAVPAIWLFGGMVGLWKL